MRRVGIGAGAALLLTLTGPTVPADATTPLHTIDARTAPELESARAKADALQARLEALQDRVDWTQERLAYALDQLAEATSRAVTADQQLATLQGVSSTAEIDIAHRVRAIEQSGGAAALFTQALDADAITDVASNVAALNGVLATDVVRASDAETASAQMAQVRLDLATISDERAAIAARAKALAAQSRELLAAQRALVSAADDRVAALVAARERRLEKRAAAAVAPWSGAVPSGPTPYASQAIAAALSKLGSPYVWGTEGPDTFDCSGLLQWAYLQAGLVLPRVSSDQWFATTPVPVDQMQPGDLLVYAYDTSDADTIHHITMYIGEGQMVHAPRTGDVVRVVPVYYEGLYGVGRPGV
jgi:cell wall-associated NlpC family hydrolase